MLRHELHVSGRHSVVTLGVVLDVGFGPHQIGGLFLRPRGDVLIDLELRDAGLVRGGNVRGDDVLVWSGHRGSFRHDTPRIRREGRGIHLPSGARRIVIDEDGTVSTPAADFIDRTLRAEATEWRQWQDRDASVGGLRVYGASIGAIRGTVRDALRRHRELGRDEILALVSELWAAPVLERRLAAVVLLQRQQSVLGAGELTRIEGLLRDARVPELIDPLTTDVVRPLLDRLTGVDAERAARIVERWASEPSDALRRATHLLSVP
jgi:hypothetical protein